MTATTSLFNIFFWPKVKTTNRSFDYQIELSAIWLDALEVDKSGVFEKSIRHGDGCKCCTGSRKGV